MEDEYLTLQISRTQLAQWTVRIRIPEEPDTNSVIFLLHGWTGDENSMSIFASRLPKNKILIMPRGIHQALEGYSWYPRLASQWPGMNDFGMSVDALTELLDKENFPIELINCDCLNQIGLIGFSQGAALAYAFSVSRPDRVERLAGLSGFLPVDFNPKSLNDQFVGKRIFIAHGTQDRIVPVEMARLAVKAFSQLKGDVTFCLDDVGHKLSSSCFRGLAQFFLN